MPPDATGLGSLDGAPPITTGLAANTTTFAYFSDDPISDSMADLHQRQD